MGRFLHPLFATGILALFFSVPSLAPARANDAIIDPLPDAFPNYYNSSTAPILRAAQEYLIFLPTILNSIPEPLGELASSWYLMVDDGHIQYRDVQRQYHPFQKYSKNPVIRADRAWEGHIIQLFGTVLPGFRMWYSSLNRDLNLTQVLYADSQDGLAWNKPVLNGAGSNALFDGQKANLVSVLHTPKDRVKPFKLVVIQNGAFHGYWSEDGINTTPYPENPILVASDIAHFYWDPNTEGYRGTAKGSKTIFDVRRRIIQFIESTDFIHWNLGVESLEPDIIDETLFTGYYTNFYGMPVFPIGEQYIGLLWILKARDQAGLHGQVFIQLVSSHDGVHWIREEGNRPAILDVGQPGAWDAGQVYTAIKPVKVGEKLWLYYSGCNLEHGASIQNTVCSIGLARIAYNRLASLTGSGGVITEPLSPTGSNLHINYDGSKGAVQVELLLDDQPIPGYEVENCLPLTADSQDQIVAWLGGTELPVEPFQIKFYLQNSALYAFAMQNP